MKLGLVPKIIIGIILGTLIGQYMPEVCHPDDDPGLCHDGDC